VLQLIVPGLQAVPHGTPAVQAMQLPDPLQTWFVPHAVPPDAFVCLQTGAPVLQLVVPGLHVVPHEALIVHATQLPLPSHTWLVPHDVPAALIFWFLQVGVPVLQSKVPGLHDEPQAAPCVQATQLPAPSQTCPVPHDVPAVALLCRQTCAPVLQLYVPGLHVVPQEPPAVQAPQFPAPSQT
jgi:hypothetical protein